MSRKRPARLIIAGAAWIVIGSAFAGLALNSLSTGAEYAMPAQAAAVLLALAAAGVAAGVSLLMMKTWSRRLMQIITWLLYPVVAVLGLGLGVMLMGITAFGDGSMYGALGLLIGAAGLFGPGWILWAVGSRPVKEALAPA